MTREALLMGKGKFSTRIEFLAAEGIMEMEDIKSYDKGEISYITAFYSVIESCGDPDIEIHEAYEQLEEGQRWLSEDEYFEYNLRKKIMERLCI